MSHTVQLTLDFLLKNSDERPENFFCLKWTQRECPEEYPYFGKIKMQNANFSYGFVNKLLHLPIILSGHIKSRKDKLLIELPIEGEVPIYSNIHFLKSHLQKCIRLKHFSQAIQTAKHLIDLDPIQFLRRLSIIFVEDCTITQHYSTIIWLMIAISSNKIILQLHHIEYLLGLIHLACQSKYRENFDLPQFDHLNNEKFAKLIIETAQPIQDKYQFATIHSLLIRSSYGGMHGDTRMLLNMAYIMTNRFLHTDDWKSQYYVENRSIAASVLPLQKNNWVLSAIDFHCFPKMIQWIQETEDIPEEDLKSIIWHFNSKINSRPFLHNPPTPFQPSNYQKEIWNKIEKQVKSIARYAIKNYS